MKVVQFMEDGGVRQGLALSYDNHEPVSGLPMKQNDQRLRQYLL